jgi:hypothetical protein
MNEQFVVNRVEGLKEAIKYARLMGYVLQEQLDYRKNSDLDIIFKDYKTWGFNCDGYDVYVYFNCVETSFVEDEKYVIETLQIWSENLYFIPFNVAFKIVMAFFGNENFVLTQIVTPDKLIYCWNKMYDSDGNSTKPDKKICIEKNFMNTDYYLSKEVPSFF